MENRMHHRIYRKLSTKCEILATLRILICLALLFVRFSLETLNQVFFSLSKKVFTMAAANRVVLSFSTAAKLQQYLIKSRWIINRQIKSINGGKYIGTAKGEASFNCNANSTSKLTEYKENGTYKHYIADNKFTEYKFTRDYLINVYDKTNNDTNNRALIYFDWYFRDNNHVNNKQNKDESKKNDNFFLSVVILLVSSSPMLSPDRYEYRSNIFEGR